MITVADVVEEIILESEIALTALSGGYLNLSAFAKTIKKEVEERSKKPVRVGTIVVALSRLTKKLGKQKALIPEVVVDEFTVKTPLVELSFERTNENIERLRKVYLEGLPPNEFLDVTQSSSEITLIVNRDQLEKILKIFAKVKPKARLENLAAFTVKFKEEYIDEPNVIYALLRKLAIRKINIVEIVSTYTELTFILNANDIDDAFNAFGFIKN